MATAQNRSNDDSGRPSNPSNPDVKTAGNTQTAAPSVVAGSGVSNSGTTTAGKTDIANATQDKSPTVRPNPLGYFASYDYQLTLYMITPDALDAFRQSNRKNINDLVAKSNNGGQISGGAYIIAQSGGIDNTSTVRAPKFELDYYIDNLSISNAVGPNENRAPTVTTRINFSITEPYGFSFLSRLKIASDSLEQYSRTLNIKDLENSTRNFFVLGVKFQGYDKYGKLYTGKETVDGRVLDPTGSGNGLFETFYEIIFRKVTFKIDGKATTYNIEAVSLNVDTLSIDIGRVPTQVSIEAGTVIEALEGQSGLLTLINKFYEGKKTDLTPKYKVEFIGDFNDLKNAVLVLPEDVTKWKWPIKRNPNDPAGVKASPNPNKKLISFSNSPGPSIIEAMEKIFTQSSFLRNAFKVTPTNEVEPNPVTNSDDDIKPDSVKFLRWYCITTNVKILGYSKDLKKFVYETTYVISPYETPVVLSTYIKNLPKYYGPVKRYQYWFTGKNTEIISYEQVNNNGYFIISEDVTLTETTSRQVPINTSLQQQGDKTGRTYSGNEAINSVTSNLYDPKSYSNAKMTILGDPDFLVQDSLNYDVGTNAFNQFFAPNGTTVNPTGGQVFIEVDFKEGIDYKYDTGTLSINESITLWQYPEAVKNLVQGVSYQVKKVVSHFKQGKFTQDLEMFINLLEEENITRPNSNQTSRENQSQVNGTRTGTGSTNTPGGTTTSTNNGLVQNPAVSNNQPPSPSPNSNQSPDQPGTTVSYNNTDSDGGREG